MIVANVSKLCPLTCCLIICTVYSLSKSFLQAAHQFELVSASKNRCVCLCVCARLCVCICNGPEGKQIVPYTYI